MLLDLRLPLGLLFLVLGALLVATGATFDERLTLWTGLSMFGFGSVAFALALRAGRRAPDR